MKSFGQFLNTDKGHFSETHPQIANFLDHLSSHTLRSDAWWNKHGLKHLRGRLSEDEGMPMPPAGAVPMKKVRPKAHPVDHIKAAGRAALPEGNPFHHMRQGFHAAFPDNEDPKITEKKALEAQKHFRQFMHERGGHTKKNNLSLTSENGKTRLSSGEGVKTIGLALTPHKSHGYEHDLCPKASSECRKNCLGFTAGGNARYPEDAFRGKLLRTQYIHEHPEHAARLLSKEIGANEKKAKKIGMKSGVRLNITSDLPWEHMMPKKFHEKHGDSQFYDYTKVHGRLNKDLPKNYSLALSHTGSNHPESNDKAVAQHLARGGVAAMVYHRGKDVPHPTHAKDMTSGKMYRITNGDDDDNVYDRHRANGIDPSEGVVSGLKLKGVRNEAAGKFANRVNKHGIIEFNHPEHHPDHWNHAEWKKKQANPFNIVK